MGEMRVSVRCMHDCTEKKVHVSTVAMADPCTVVIIATTIPHPPSPIV
ncbi:MAG: hypothetical protein QXS27_03515 [Candidatus Jordarchaeaceae archaeon]